MERKDEQTSRREKPASEAAPTRRPYRRPEISTFPLFERMALACNPDLKGSGEEDNS